MGDRQEVERVLAEGEKVVAGTIYMYREKGLPSVVLEARTKVPLDQELLDLALADVVARYPYFGTKFEERDGNFYIKKNDLPLKSVRTEKLIPLGGHTNNYHLMGITLTDTYVRLSLHHGLTDGGGAKIFLRALLDFYNDYATADDIEAVKAAHAALVDELSMGEMAETIGPEYKAEKVDDVEGLVKDGFHVPESDNKGAHRRYELTFSQDEFMAACKKIGATPIVMLSMMMGRGIKEAHPECDKPIISTFPADVRQTLGCPNTYKNCVFSISLPYGAAQEAMGDEELAASWRSMMKEQVSYDQVAKQFNNMGMLMNLIGMVPSYDLRKMLLSPTESLAMDTYVTSYIGRFELPENLVSDVHVFSSLANGLSLFVTCQDGTFALDIIQDFASDLYAQALVKQFEQIGVEVSASDEILFETPRDEVSEIMSKRESLWDKLMQIDLPAAISNFDLNEAISSIELPEAIRDIDLPKAVQKILDETPSLFMP